MAVYYNGDYASSRGFETSLIKSFSHKFSAEINYTYQLATGVASDPNWRCSSSTVAGSTCRSPSRRWTGTSATRSSVQAMVQEPGKWGFRVLWSYGSGFPFTPTFRNDRKPDPALENSRRLPSAARLTVDGDKFYKVWGQNVKLFFDARNVLELEEHPAARRLQRDQPVHQHRG